MNTATSARRASRAGRSGVSRTGRGRARPSIACRDPVSSGSPRCRSTARPAGSRAWPKAVRPSRTFDIGDRREHDRLVAEQRRTKLAIELAAHLRAAGHQSSGSRADVPCPAGQSDGEASSSEYPNVHTLGVRLSSTASASATTAPSTHRLTQSRDLSVLAHAIVAPGLVARTLLRRSLARSRRAVGRLPPVDVRNHFFIEPSPWRPRLLAEQPRSARTAGARRSEQRVPELQAVEHSVPEAWLVRDCLSGSRARTRIASLAGDRRTGSDCQRGGRVPRKRNRRPGRTTMERWPGMIKPYSSCAIRPIVAGSCRGGLVKKAPVLGPQGHELACRPNCRPALDKCASGKFVTRITKATDNARKKNRRARRIMTRELRATRQKQLHQYSPTAELFLDAQEPVVLRDAVRARRCASLDLTTVGRDREVATKVSRSHLSDVNHRPVRGARGTRHGGQGSLRVPTWFTFTKMAFATPAAIPVRASRHW